MIQLIIRTNHYQTPLAQCTRAVLLIPLGFSGKGTLLSVVLLGMQARGACFLHFCGDKGEGKEHAE